MGCKVHKFLGWNVHWFLGCKVHRFLGCKVHRFLGCKVHWFLGCKVHWFSGCKVHWFLGCKVHWFLGWKVHKMFGCEVCRFWDVRFKKLYCNAHTFLGCTVHRFLGCKFHWTYGPKIYEFYKPKIYEFYNPKNYEPYNPKVDEVDNPKKTLWTPQPKNQWTVRPKTCLNCLGAIYIDFLEVFCWSRFSPVFSQQTHMHVWCSFDVLLRNASARYIGRKWKYMCGQRDASWSHRQHAAPVRGLKTTDPLIHNFLEPTTSLVDSWKLRKRRWKKNVSPLHPAFKFAMGLLSPLTSIWEENAKVSAHLSRARVCQSTHIFPKKHIFPERDPK